MTVSARLLAPTTITNAMLGGGTTLPEPATAYGEVAWVASGTYTLNQERTYSGSVYTCVLGHTGIATLPNADPTRWLRKGPTLRMAPFDDYTSTTATAVGTLTYVINPTFIDGLNMYGLVGTAYSVVIKDGPGGATLVSQSGDLYEQAVGLWELAFAPLNPVDRIAIRDIPLSPTTEVTITITAGVSGPVAIGDLKLGGWRILTGGSTDFGGVQYGASSERKSYTSRTYNVDGTYTTVKRNVARDLKCTVILASEFAMYADGVLREIQDVAVPFEAVDVEGYDYLSTLGFISSSMYADNFSMTRIDLTIKGNI